MRFEVDIAEPIFIVFEEELPDIGGYFGYRGCIFQHGTP